MAKFKDITESINYVAETVPVVALSLKPQLLEVYKKKKKKRRQKKLKQRYGKNSMRC
ncbi:hypothetical protein ACQBBH_00745 (plasmid) [Enterococcus faecium]|uniref:hypothetical protein n=1 Tax=Enterococcus faecium TaxID=1352 RepID=UPI003F833F49